MKQILIILFLIISQLGYSQRNGNGGNGNGNGNGNGHNDDDLPIVLTEFKAKANTNSVKIIWSTETETDNDYFTLLHSPDGYEYYYLTTINGAGTTHIPKNYYFIDKNPYNGVNYYVLMQTDYNGEREIFPPISSYFLKPEDEQYIWEYYNFLGQKIK